MKTIFKKVTSFFLLTTVISSQQVLAATTSCGISQSLKLAQVYPILALINLYVLLLQPQY